MSTNNESALLLRMNKQEQLAALREIGFINVSESTPASDIAKYIKWAGGLLDLSLVVIKIETGERMYFAAAEWNAMNANNRSKYIRIGIRIRAECRQFVISKAGTLVVNDSLTFKWGGYGTDVIGLKNYSVGSQGLYDTFDGKENTDAIIKQLAGVKDTQGTIGSPAAEAARGYKACTLEADGLDDTTLWNLPALGELMLISKYILDINELISSMFGVQNIIKSDWYWSSTECSATNSWMMSLTTGGFFNNPRATGYRVCPVSAIDSLSL